MKDSRYATPDLAELAGLFYASIEELGDFDEVAAGALPLDYRTLLAHNNHMTVTVEAFHRSPVEVRVLEKRIDGLHYARKILLARQSDGAVVQYGIMRVDFKHLDEPIRREIQSQRVPLGRVLIAHDVLREVELVSLWRIEPGRELGRLLGVESNRAIYGRTALIHVDGEPAVELLEIVNVSQPSRSA